MDAIGHGLASAGLGPIGAAFLPPTPQQQRIEAALAPTRIMPPTPAELRGMQASPGELAGPPGPPPGPPGAPPEDSLMMPPSQPTGGGPVRMGEQDRLGPTARRDLTKLRSAEDAYAQHGGDPYAQIASDEERLAAQREGEIAVEQRLQEKRDADRAREMQAKQDDFNATAKELANTKIDSGHFWASRSTGQKIAGLIGIALGGFASGAGGGNNPALDMIDKAIDRDVEDQKAAFMAKKEGLAAKQSAFGMAMQRYGDERQAEAIARAAGRDAYLAQAQALAAKSKNAEVMDRFKQLETGVLANRARDSQQFMAYGAVGGGGGAPNKDLAKIREHALAFMQAHPTNPDGTPTDFRQVIKQIAGAYGMGPVTAGGYGGSQGQGNNMLAGIPKDQHEAATKELEARSKADASANRVTELFKQYESAGLLSPKQRDALRAAIATTVKQGAGPGMSSDQDYSRFIEPNLPSALDTDVTRAQKIQNITGGLKASAPTPTLDRYGVSGQSQRPAMPASTPVVPSRK